MATYLILNGVVMILVAAILAVTKVRLDWKIIAGSVAVIVACTAVFDSIIVSTRIVSYAADKIWGIYVGSAPIEDFAYAIVAAVLVPYIWLKLGGKPHEDH